MVLSHVMRGRPSCLLQSAGGEANRILLASVLSSMRIILLCPNRVSRHDWIIAVSLGCFVSLHTSSFCTNWYHLMPSSIRRYHWWRHKNSTRQQTRHLSRLYLFSSSCDCNRCLSFCRLVTCSCISLKHITHMVRKYSIC